MRTRPENFKGVKGRSGRRTISEEVIKKAAEWHYKELAKTAVSRHLEAMAADPESHQDEIKEIALPIVLRDMTEKVDHTTLGEKIINNDKVNELIEILKDNGLHSRRSETSNGTNSDEMDFSL